MKIFYSVVPDYADANTMHVLLLATQKSLAKKLYEMWNNNDFVLTNKMMKAQGLTIKKFTAEDIQ